MNVRACASACVMNQIVGYLSLIKEVYCIANGPQTARVVFEADDRRHSAKLADKKPPAVCTDSRFPCTSVTGRPQNHPPNHKILFSFPVPHFPHLSSHS